MSIQKKLIGIIATAATVAFIVAPVTSALASHSKKLPCYGVKGQKEGVAVMKTAKQCKKVGGSNEAPAAKTS